MKLHELSPVAGSTHVAKRKGRGVGTKNDITLYHSAMPSYITPVYPKMVPSRLLLCI